MPTEIIAEIVGLYRSFTDDDQAEWLRLIFDMSGVKNEARSKDITASDTEKKTYRPTWLHRSFTFCEHPE